MRTCRIQAPLTPRPCHCPQRAEDRRSFVSNLSGRLSLYGMDGYPVYAPRI